MGSSGLSGAGGNAGGCASRLFPSLPSARQVCARWRVALAGPTENWPPVGIPPRTAASRERTARDVPACRGQFVSRVARAQVTEGLVRAGRPAEAVDVPACVWVSVDEDGDAADAALAAKLAFYGGAFAPYLLERAGLAREDFAPAAAADRRHRRGRPPDHPGHAQARHRRDARRRRRPVRRTFRPRGHPSFVRATSGAGPAGGRRAPGAPRHTPTARPVATVVEDRRRS